MKAKDCRSRPLLSTPFRPGPPTPGTGQGGNSRPRSLDRSTDSVRSARGKRPARPCASLKFPFDFNHLAPARTVINPSSGYVGRARRCHYPRVADQSGGTSRTPRHRRVRDLRRPRIAGLRKGPEGGPPERNRTRTETFTSQQTTPLRPGTDGPGRNLPERHAAMIALDRLRSRRVPLTPQGDNDG